MKKVLLASAVSLALVGVAHADEHGGTYAFDNKDTHQFITCLLYTSPSPRD